MKSSGTDDNETNLHSQRHHFDLFNAGRDFSLVLLFKREIGDQLLLSTFEPLSAAEVGQLSDQDLTGVEFLSMKLGILRTINRKINSILKFRFKKG